MHDKVAAVHDRLDEISGSLQAKAGETVEQARARLDDVRGILAAVRDDLNDVPAETTAAIRGKVAALRTQIEATLQKLPETAASVSGQVTATVEAAAAAK